MALRLASCMGGGLDPNLYYVPGDSSRDLFGMVSLRDPFKGEKVTSNYGMKRSRLESPGFCNLKRWIFFWKTCGNWLKQQISNDKARLCSNLFSKASRLSFHFPLVVTLGYLLRIAYTLENSHGTLPNGGSVEMIFLFKWVIFRFHFTDCRGVRQVSISITCSWKTTADRPRVQVSTPLLPGWFEAWVDYLFVSFCNERFVLNNNLWIFIWRIFQHWKGQ